MLFFLGIQLQLPDNKGIKMKRTHSSLMRAHSRGSFSRLVFESEHSNGGGEPDRSLLFRSVQLFVIIFRLITPFSYVYLASLIYYLAKAGNYALITNIPMVLFTLWMAMEALFFPYYYMLFTHLNSQKHELEVCRRCKKSNYLFI